MADAKITDLTAYTPAIDTDVLPIVDVTTSTTKKITVANLVNTSTPPTDLKLSTASKGGVFNGGFELYPDTTQRNTSWMGNDIKYGHYFYNGGGTATGGFDNTVSKKGSVSAKMVISASSTGKLGNRDQGGGAQLQMIPVKVNTTYRLSAWVKADSANISAGYIAYQGFTSALAYVNTLGAVNFTTSAAFDWTYYSTTFTTGASTELINYFITVTTGAGGAVNFWVDDVILEEVVTDTTFTGKTVEKIRPVLTAVTSTDNIDQSLDTGGAYANTYALTNAVNEGATHIQTFTPTKKYTTQIGIWPVAAGTAVDWNLVVHTAGNVVVASCKILAASIATGAFQYFDVPNVWASGALHFHVFASATTGTPTCKVNTTDDLETASYIQRYAKKSETYSVVSNGIKTELKADKDGLLTGSIVDLDNGKYRYASGTLPGTATVNSIAFASNVFSATVGGNWGGDVIKGINGYNISYSAGITTDSDTTARSYILKVNTLLPIKHLKVKYGLGRNAAFSIQTSPDNVTYTVLGYGAASEATYQIAETDLLNGLSTFYIKVNKDATNAYFIFQLLQIEADLDTSKIPTGLFYPIGTNQFTETVTLPSTADRLYFQSAKYTNEYGVVVPALELCSTATPVGYIPLKLDNSQEASPCVSILSTTTNYQQSGTGSNVTGGVVLNTGEYVTLTSAVASLKIDYQVGTGTTAIAAITKNTIYYSSNGEGNDATQDPSHQMSVDLGIRQQGVLQRVSDIGEEIAKVREGVLKTTSWTDWTPTLTWTTGTPEGSVVTKARYKILDGVCYFAFYYSATDANAATALTISLPVLPKDNDSLTALQSQELADTTWSNPIAYIDDGGTTIVFRSFSTIADTKAVKVLVSGIYEI